LNIYVIEENIKNLHESIFYSLLDYSHNYINKYIPLLIKNAQNHNPQEDGNHNNTSL